MQPVITILALLAGQVAAGVVPRVIVTEIDTVTTYITAQPVTVIVQPTQISSLLHTSSSVADGPLWLPGVIGHPSAHTTTSISSSAAHGPLWLPGIIGHPASHSITSIAHSAPQPATTSSVHSTVPRAPTTTTQAPPPVTTPTITPTPKAENTYTLPFIFSDFGPATYVTLR